MKMIINIFRIKNFVVFLVALCCPFTAIGKVEIPKMLPRNASNDISGHTYAVIINGVGDMKSNKESYWDDCAFMYITLHDIYGIPHDNIYVAMSDGKNPSKDLTKVTGEEISSPLDLNEDGIDDIQYVAAKTSLKLLFDDLSATLTDKDHLYVFVTGHGGFSTEMNESYMCLWNNDRLYPGEFSEFIADINAGFITLVFGQCYSGGFIKKLSADNRIIITACGENELSYEQPDGYYSEFLYQLTSAMAGFDTEGNDTYADTDKNGIVTIREAYDYAKSHDCYIDGDLSSIGITEHPTINLLEGSTSEELSFTNIPNTVELYVSERDKHYWDNCQLWGANEISEIADQKYTNIDFSTGNEKYVTVNVGNRGVKPYNTSDKYINVYWAEAALNITKNTWLGVEKGTEGKLGGLFSSEKITTEIAPNKKSEIILRKTFTENEIAQIKKDNSTLNYLVCLSNDGNPDLQNQDTCETVDIMDNKNIAQKSVINLKHGDEKTLYIHNNTSEEKSYDIRIVNENIGTSIFEDAEIGIVSSDISSNYSLLNNVYKENDVPYRFVVCAVNGGSIEGIELDKSDIFSTTMSCQFYANKDILERKEYKFSAIMTDNKNGMVVGGETFTVTKLPRKAIHIRPECYIYNGETYLSVAEASENVTLKWYAPNGNFLYEGRGFSLGQNFDIGKYTVKAISTKDGSIANFAIDVIKDYLNKYLSLNKSNSTVVIGFRSELDKNVCVQISTSRSPYNIAEYNLEKGRKQFTLNIPGIYNVQDYVIVTFIVDGIKTETYKIK